MHFKQRLFSARRICLHVESLRASRAEAPGGQTNWRLSALYIKKIQNIMRYQLYLNASYVLYNVNVVQMVFNNFLNRRNR